MALNRYSRYKIIIDPASKKKQGLRPGDVVRRQYSDHPDLIYSLMVVLDTGVDVISGQESHYFIGALVEGNEPRNGELLDFVRVTSLTDRSRGGALYLTASDSDSPYLDVIDGLGTEYSLLYTGQTHRTDTRFVFPISGNVENPEMLLISYRIRASEAVTDARLTIGYDDETDGEEVFSISTEWEYRLTTIFIDHPGRYARELVISPGLPDGWCEVSALNVVRLSDITGFARSSKARMGKITGITDPVFGVLEGYGAYFQNLYATRNVNIAGTLTAGDQNGFASTFYVGKIHKNAILNSIGCAFTGSTEELTATPVGIGQVRRIPSDTQLEVQSSAWRQERTGKTYCFSLWLRSDAGSVTFYQDEHRIGSIICADGADWRRYKIVFTVKSSAATSMNMCLSSDRNGMIVTAPQLEAGETASQYQPTDDKLNYTEDYGAWLCKGGIGGTIQNPLLKLNEDGSVSSCDDSFVINRDGTGHFAHGKFRWTHDDIKLTGVTIRWENLDEEVKDQILSHIENSLPDWVTDWDSNKTVIDAHSVITPKIFAGVKNADHTITGVAIGKFPLSVRDDAGAMGTETINGIYGFRAGYKTFYIDSNGSAGLGRGNNAIRYNAVSGKIEFGSEVAMAWAGATYIDADGIFTGTLSAETVNAVRISASQVTTGTLSADRIDVNALKATLITAGNIEALTLNVTQGKIGGWSLDNDSIFRGPKNNISGTYTGASGSITIGSTGIRGFKWRFDSTGAGALAAGNIAWDTSGNVSFSSSVSLAWSAPINTITEALGGASFPKMTHISSSGIYTGTLTANQINAGTISTDRIAAGSITASKLDAASIRADLINVNYINGLVCAFTKGTIGGWTINGTSVSGGQIVLDSGNKRIAVYGASSSPASGQRTMLYHNSNTDFGLYSSDTTGNAVVRLGSVNQVAGWIINVSQIYKNNVCLDSDGSIHNSSKWRLNNDGSGSVASGNISWNTAGAVSFSAAVSLLWKNDFEAARKENFGYPYYKNIVVNGDENTYYPVVIKGGDQNFKRDILIRRAYDEQAPDSWNTATHKGGLLLLLKTNFGSWGGIGYSWDIYELSELYTRTFAGAVHCGNSCMFAVFLRGGGSTGAIYHLYSDQPIESTAMSPPPIPASPQITYNEDLIFQSGSSLAYAPAPRTLTAAVEEEIRRRRFISLAQGSDSTLAEHPLTYIGPTGIYTGTLTADQINAGTISTDRIAAGSITAAKLDAASLRASIINTDYINGLSCTFIRGKIGGFTIGSDHMSVGNIGGLSQTPLQIRSASTGSGYWYTGSYKPFGVAITWYRSSNAGHIVLGQIAASGNSVKTGFIGLQMMSWDNVEYFCLSANHTRVGSKEVYNRIAGWAFDQANIWKNNVYLGSDGSIHNGTKWQLNNDGAGRLANGNILWDAAGNVTFGSSVSLNWTNAATNALNSAKNYADTKKTEAINTAATDATNKANAAKELASAMAYGKMLYRDPTFFNGNNSINVYNNLGNGTVAIARISDTGAPNDSKYVLKIVNTGSATPGCGGFYFGTSCSNRKIFVTRFIAKVPVGRSLQWASNSIGTGGSSKWLTSNAGTGEWAEYIYKVTCGTSNFSSTNFFYIEGSTTLTWYVAYATVFDVTSVEKYTTTIDANGIYTGTLNAGQISAGTIGTDRIAAGSIHASKLNAASIKSDIINTSYINGLTCTFVRGTIGGWSISSVAISKNSVSLSSDGSIVNGTKWKLNNNGSGQLANGNITWDTAGNVTARGAIFNNVRIQGSLRNPFVLNDSSIWIGGDTSNQQNFNNYDNIVAIRGSWDENIALPWTLTNSGRRVTLVNYKWGSNATTGYMTIYAPSGKYFFEDGIQKTSITFSREMLELLGYGDNSTFFGWIVTNRRDIMCTSRYGSFLPVLASGIVTVSGTSVRLKQKTFDGTKMSVSRTGTGRYTVYLPWGLNSNYFVQMTGYYTGGPIYATIRGTYSSYFYVQTQDDSTANEGSFCFQVFSTADWQ